VKATKTSPASKSKSAPKARPAAAAAPGPAVEDPGSEVELNWKIISLLQEDGRMPFSTIAERVGVSEGTVRNRMKQLRDDNVMQITAQVLPEAFGYHWNSVVFLKLCGKESLDAVARRLAQIPEVYYIVHMTGAHDLAITSFHRDREHFREFLTQHLYGHDEIQSIEANVNLKVFKMRLKWSAEML
jgi:Lrp/AsnC family transcriptional regulator for asnA, asnC and gidA